MKSQKYELKFKDKTNQEVVDYFNEEYPINIISNLDLINRISTRYPYVSRAEVIIVVRAVLKSIRDLLLLGKKLRFVKFFFIKLYLIKVIRKGIAQLQVRPYIKISKNIISNSKVSRVK